MATSYDPEYIRPRRDWCIVLEDPRNTVLDLGTREDGSKAQIILTEEETGVEKVSDGVGTIIRVGPGIKNDRQGLREGMRVAYRGYLKFANHIMARRLWSPSELRDHGFSFEDAQKASCVKQYFFISSDDLYGEVAEGVQVGVMSRPQNRVSNKKVRD
jgi:hypothetical protein